MTDAPDKFPFPPERKTKGPRHGDPRITAEEMVSEALIAAGLRPPGQRSYSLNSREAHQALTASPAERTTSPRWRREDVVWVRKAPRPQGFEE